MFPFFIFLACQFYVTNCQFFTFPTFGPTPAPVTVPATTTVTVRVTNVSSTQIANTTIVPTTSTTTQRPILDIAREIIRDDLAWSYENQDKWRTLSDTCTKGERQSPIALSLEDSVTSPGLRNDKLQFNNYDKRIGGKLVNTGQAVVWNVDILADKNSAPNISGCGLLNFYILGQIVFKTSPPARNAFVECCSGSEHIVEFKRYPMEVQFVHYNSNYDKMEDAVRKSDGLAIISFLFQRTSETSSVEFTPIVKALPTISTPLVRSAELPMIPDRLVPSFAKDSGIFFRYQGSLTAPPCEESVKWTVYRNIGKINMEDLKRFWFDVERIFASNLTNINEPRRSYRNIQARNKRQIFTNGIFFNKFSFIINILIQQVRVAVLQLR